MVPNHKGTINDGKIKKKLECPTFYRFILKINYKKTGTLERRLDAISSF